MRSNEVQTIVDRVRRIAAGLSKSTGLGLHYSATASNAEGVHYSIAGIRTFEEYGDLVANLCVWTWSLKDHIRNLFAGKGISEQEVEDAVDASFDLKVCSDIRNRGDHGKLEKHGRPHSRSGLFARLGPVAIVVPEQNIQALIAEPGNKFTISLQNPDSADFRAPVLAEDGTDLGDAVVICARAMEAWKALLLRHGFSVAW